MGVGKGALAPSGKNPSDAHQRADDQIVTMSKQASTDQDVPVAEMFTVRFRSKDPERGRISPLQLECTACLRT